MANNLTRFNPFGDLARFDAFRDFEDMFKNFPLGGASAGQAAVPRINLDVSESDQAYVVKAEAPGAKKEDVKVTVDGNAVTIRIETRQENQEKQGETVLRSERYYGVQTRRFTLAHDIDDARAAARYQDGILELTLPKKADGGGAKVLQIT
ncbi:Hsp20/alpha crystallin family protein [Pollutimonas bauzanensis]|uniref:HSP20 family protein n=1 Tax=Pollutimonas bauzanensis TaxID=658167 RepID=A0A1M5QMC7_9BURK|nr:Hsp20/alpha crystallin family protein [Pollutimonas bauzanensis]SHH15212.1 HSP20 family protein [Pollutimonas bauzanensis]